MSSMSSVTLTRERNPRPARRPWLAPLVLVLLAILYGAVALWWTLTTFGARGSEEHDVAFVVAGPIAETVEAVLTESDETDLQLYGDLLVPMFDDWDSLAYVRIWDPRLRLTCELSRDLTVPRAGNGGRLPDLGLEASAAGMIERQQDSGWLQTITDLQGLLATQREVSMLLESAVDEGQSGRAVVSGTYTLQEDALKLAEILQRKSLPMESVLKAMRAVLDNMTGEGAEAVAAAWEAARRAENGLAMALVEHRITLDTLPALPASLANAEPGAHWPFLRGRRALLPVFTPVIGEVALAHAGYVEVGFYDRPLPRMLLLAVTPSIVLLLAALVIALVDRPRKRREEDMDEDEG
ncbi:MAG: hypothetical protein BWY76_01220 [bacterium ADurb.Bin429]|nr:MAG: hypothetical protein BWY76_01220 [bacterium ADurb.Bin429]